MDWNTVRDSHALRTLATGLRNTAEQLDRRADTIDEHPPHMRGGRSWHYDNIRGAHAAIALYETGHYRDYPIALVSGHDATRIQATKFWIERLLKRREKEQQDAKTRACLSMLHRGHKQNRIAQRLNVSQGWVSKVSRAQRLPASQPSEPRQARA